MVKIPICSECEYYIGRNDKGCHICKAFYNGIPNDVSGMELIKSI